VVRSRYLGLLGLIMISLGFSGFLTSYFIIGHNQFASVFLGWLFSSLVFYLVVSSSGYASNPESIINSYRSIVRQVLEEFDLQHEYPYFIPSSLSKAPALFIVAGDDPKFSSIPRRFIVLGGLNGLRLETLGSYLVGELGGVGSDLSSAESMLKSILVTYLEMARDVEVVESGGYDIIVSVSKYVRDYIEGDPPAVNIYVQIIGPIIADALDNIIKLVSCESDGGRLIVRFHVWGV
jgi:hypothetical protein